MSENITNYTKLDEKIDKYLGTTNLRPGPPRRLANQPKKENEKVWKIKGEVNIPKTKINFCSYPMKIEKNIKWSE